MNEKCDYLFLLCRTTMNLYSTLLCGNPTINQAKLLKEIKDGKEGQLAIESSSLFIPMRLYGEGKKDKALIEFERRIGRITKICWEPIFSEEEFQKNGYEKNERPQEKIFYLDAMNGQNIRWHNCSFIGVTEKSIYDL